VVGGGDDDLIEYGALTLQAAAKKKKAPRN
jgi:hypothetical protein